MDFETQYADHLSAILYNGYPRTDRTGTGTHGLNGLQIRHDLRICFPLVTGKYTNFKAIKGELLWFLSGSTNTNDLDASIWDAWGDHEGNLGPIYGKQWRAWQGRNPLNKVVVDQIAVIQDGLRNHPDSRRHILTAWNVSDLSLMKLAPCHFAAQFISRPMPTKSRALDCIVTQRSADMYLGVPFNLASYALLTHMMAQTTGHEAGELIWNGGDCHIYDNHRDIVEEYLRQPIFMPPSLRLNPHRKDIDDFTSDDIKIQHYDHGPVLRAPIAV